MKKLLFAIAMLMASLAVSAQDGMSEGIHISGTKILDAKNNELILRGVNYSWAWQRGHEEVVIPAAKRLGCNSIRLQLSTGRRQQQGVRPDWDPCKPEELEKLIKLCEDNKLIAIINTHDETGDNDYSALQSAVDFWISMKDILNAHLKTVIVNVSNEWYGSWESSGWANGYKQAIPLLREAGIRNMLLVDCAGWGQFPQSIQDYGSSVVEADPLHNMAFSIHFYDDAGDSSQHVQEYICNALHISNPVPLVIGEFAYEHKNKPVAWEKILSYSFEQRVGYLVWSWTGNGEGAEACDLFSDWEGKEFLPNGRGIFLSLYGIQDTSKECSYFDDSVPVNAENYNPFREGAGIDDYDFSVEEPLDESTSTLEENVTVFDNVGYDSGDWTTGPIHIGKEVLGTLHKGDKIHLYLTSGGDAQIQIAYTVPPANMTHKYIDYQDIPNWGQFDVEVDNTDGSPYFVRGLNSDGVYVNGKNIKLNRVAVTRRVSNISSGIEDVKAEVRAGRIDFSQPYEIYTIDGRRVASMNPGSVYIIRQGASVMKYLAR